MRNNKLNCSLIAEKTYAKESRAEISTRISDKFSLICDSPVF